MKRNEFCLILAAVGMVLLSRAADERNVSFADELKGRKVEVRFEVSNPGKMATGSKIELRQYDANGKRLNEDVVDPRFISMMHPAGRKTPLRTCGSIHPRAAKVTLAVDAFDGRLDVGEVKIVAAPTVAVNEKFFGSGVDGAALALSESRQFIFPVYSRAVWGQGLTVTDPRELFFPVGAGTVEAWFRPQDWKGPVRLFDAANLAPGSANAKNARGSLFFVECDPGAKTVVATMAGADGRVFAARGAFELPAGDWHHLAVTFKPEGELAVFADGRKVASAPLAGWKVPVGGDPKSGPMLFAVGAGAKDIRTAKSVAIPSYSGLVDNLRLSSAVRYRGDFSPSRTFERDADTRALFAFEKEIDGWSAGADGIVEASVRADEALYPGSRKTDYMRPAPFDTLNYKVVSGSDDFGSCRVRRTLTRKVRVGESVEFDVPENAAADFCEIRNVGRGPLACPALLGEGEVDPRTWETIRGTMGLEGLSDREKADRLFQYAVHSVDYFIWHPVCVDPGTLQGGAQNNHPLANLNAFGGSACGGLNKIASNLGTLSGGIPACGVQGYGHEFQQYWIDGATRVYDLSGQQYFERLSDDEPASLQDIEREPGTHPRYRKCADHFTRLFSHAPWASRPYYARKYLLTLKPGEAFRASRFNDGSVVDVWFARKGSRGVPDHPLAAKLPPESPFDRAYLMNRFLPDLANGCITYSGSGPESEYAVDFAYPAVRGEYAAHGPKGEALPLEYSVDGKKWRTLESDADGVARPVYAVRGLPRYRVRAKGVAAATFTAKTFVQMNPKVMTGLAHPGRNRIRLVAEGGGQAEVSVGWKERGGRIAVEGAVFAGTVPGAEKLIVAYDPTEGKRTLKAEGVKGGKIVLSYPDKGRPYYVHRRIAGERGGEALLVVLVGKGARVIREGSGTLAKAGDAVEFGTGLKGDGRFMLWNLTRIEGGLPFHRYGDRPFALVNAAAKRKKDRFAPCAPTRCGSDFYKAATGNRGGRSAYHWDTATEPGTKYPLEAPRTYSADEIARVRYELTADYEGGIEYFASLVVPVGDYEFMGETIRLLSGFNYIPEEEQK